jgi:hypothetical protein
MAFALLFGAGVACASWEVAGGARPPSSPEWYAKEEPVAIPVVAVAVQRLPAVAVDRLHLAVVALPVVDAGAHLDWVRVDAVAMGVVRAKDEELFALLDLWEGRHSRRLDFWGGEGNRAMPAPGTVLWDLRERVVAAVAAGGDYETLWAEYDQSLRKAMERRAGLRRQK